MSNMCCVSNLMIIRTFSYVLVYIFIAALANHQSLADNCVERVCLLMPVAGDSVSERPIVEVEIRESATEVWSIVHPMEASDFWVQPKLQPRGAGRWRGSIYIGRPGAIDVGKHFEIMVVADPAKGLLEGDILSEFPEAKYRSSIVEIIRK